MTPLRFQDDWHVVLVGEDGEDVRFHFHTDTMQPPLSGWIATLDGAVVLSPARFERAPSSRLATRFLDLTSVVRFCNSLGLRARFVRTKAGGEEINGSFVLAAGDVLAIGASLGCSLSNTDTVPADSAMTLQREETAL